jgi:hypothetical protein
MTGSAEAIHRAANGKMDCFVACAPLHKRFAFVAGNDEEAVSLQFRRIQ